MKFPRLVLAVAVILTGAVFYACTENNGTTAPAPSGTDAFKTGMLTNYADNLIIPAYADLSTKLTTLETQVNGFLDNPSANTLDAAKPAYKAAYLSYEATSAAYFGPASSLLLNNYINTFPPATTQIEKGIASGSYKFDQPVVSDSIQGFPALDYLLFAPNSVEKFTGTDAPARKKYVRDVIARMKTLVANTTAQWNGPYRASFETSLKTDVGSSIAFLVNQFAYELDALKGPRIGWPSGKRSNNIVFADKCEGYYSGLTKELAVANLTNLKNYYVGGQSNGIADYLVLLKKEPLANQVSAQFDVSINALNAIPQPMAESFTKNPAQVDEAYRQVQKLLTLIKTDVASATSVQITYMDNDGD